MIYPGAALDMAPAWKQGYQAYPSPQKKEGFVLHSMVGSYPAARARLMSTDRASWHFSVLKSGEVYQHLPSRAVAWHCGVVGDDDSLSAAVGNVALIGIEHEGGPPDDVSEPLTQKQLAATIDLQRWCYATLPELKRPALRASHFEHNWLSNTSCPSGRIPWAAILSRLEDDMALSPEATVGMEKFFGQPFLDHYGNTHESFGVYLMQVIAFLDKEHLEHIFADLDSIKQGGGNLQPVLDAIKNLNLKASP